MAAPSVSRTMTMFNLFDDTDPYNTSNAQDNIVLTQEPFVWSYTAPKETEGRWVAAAGSEYRAVVHQNRPYIRRSELGLHNKSAKRNELANQSTNESNNVDAINVQESESVGFTTTHPITMLQMIRCAQPVHLHFALCLDRSGSMQPHMNEVVTAAKTILTGLATHVMEQTLASVSVTLISFGSRVETHLEGAPLADDLDLEAMTKILEENCTTATLGGTHIEAALCEATSRVSSDIVAQRETIEVESEKCAVQGYVVLLTDGQPTLGEECPSTLKQHLFNEYIGTLPISFGAIALGSQPRRSFIEPLFEGGRFAFAVDQQGLSAAFERITDGFKDIDRNLSLVINGQDVVHGNIPHTQEWMHVCDDLLYTEEENDALPVHAADFESLQKGVPCNELPISPFGEVAEADATDSQDVKNPSTTAGTFAYSPWLYLVRGQKGADGTPVRRVELAMLQRFRVVPDDSKAMTIFYPSPEAMVDHMTLLEEQRLLQKAMSDAHRNPDDSRRKVYEIAERVATHTQSSTPSGASAARWDVMRQMSVQASDWIGYTASLTTNDATSDQAVVDGLVEEAPDDESANDPTPSEPPIKRMRGNSTIGEDASSLPAPSVPPLRPTLTAESSELMSYDLCSQSFNS